MNFSTQKTQTNSAPPNAYGGYGVGSTSKGYDGPGLGQTATGKAYSPYGAEQTTGWGGSGVPTSMGSNSSQQSTITNTVFNKSWQVVSGVAKGIGAAA